MAGVTYCHICKKVLARTKTKSEACKLATIHMAATPHILVFGYSTQQAKKNGFI
jgi:hypothetical protein